MPAWLLWYDLVVSTQKIYTTTTNNYTQFFTLFGKRPFFIQKRELAAWISHLGGKKLKPKIIKKCLSGFWSLCLDYMLNKIQLEVYSYPILQRIIAGLQKLYKKENTDERWPITRNILLWLISSFDQTIFGKTNLHTAFCLAFERFWKIRKFTYNKVKGNFNF